MVTGFFVGAVIGFDWDGVGDGDSGWFVGVGGDEVGGGLGVDGPSGGLVAGTDTGGVGLESAGVGSGLVGLESAGVGGGFVGVSAVGVGSVEGISSFIFSKEPSPKLSSKALLSFEVKS